MTLLSTIKNWFKTGQIPTQAQFWALFDSFWHKSEVIPASKIDNLQNLLDEKTDKIIFENHLSDPSAHLDLFNALLQAGKFKEALNVSDIYTEARRTGFGTNDPQATLEVLGTFNVSSDDASGATLNTIFNEPLYIGSTDVNNKLKLLLNINGTAELPNSTVALIAARGGKSIVTKDYVDGMSSYSAQIISNQFYFSSSPSNNNVWLIGNHSTSNQSGSLTYNSNSLATILAAKYAANIPAGLQVLEKGKKLTTINFILGLVQGDLSNIRLVVFAKKYNDGEAYSSPCDYLILYDGIIDIGIISSTTVSKKIIIENSPIITDDNYHVNFMLFKTKSFRGQPGLINLKLE